MVAIMKTLCITAQRSDLGKTVLSERLLARLENWAACKVTLCTDGPHVCPRGRNCGACGSLEGDYVIETDEQVIAQKGKDTARLLNAGAAPVFWIKAKEEFVKDAIDEALARLSGAEGVLLEGNGALKAIKPDLAVMVTSPDGKMKNSARDIWSKIDMFVEDVNDEKVLEAIWDAVAVKAVSQR